MERKMNICKRNLTEKSQNQVAGERRRLIQREQTSRTSTTNQIGDISKHV